MKTTNFLTGMRGQNLAEEHLQDLGYSIIDRNFSTKFGEIDLIVQDDKVLVFVEVKTKIGADFGSPEDMFTKRKYERVKRMATLYLSGRSVPCRIDMVAVVLDRNNQPVSIKHYENVTS